MKKAYYNEIDPFCAQWLHNLIAAGHIAPGDVDERSIVDIKPDDLRGYTQCHLFAGIGGWSYALRRAGWPDDRPVWTGSCPCQPFSGAGKGAAFADERHLWPAWFYLIAKCKPARIFGEQVEAAIGWGWLDAVFSDLEGEGYACGAAVLPACSVGAPHIRQRLWFVAGANEGQRRRLADGQGRERDGQTAGRQQSDGIAQSCGITDDLANANGARCGAGRTGEARDGRDAPRVEPTGLCASGLLGNPDNPRPQGWGEHRNGADELPARPASVAGELEHAARDRREQRRPEPSGRGAAGGCGESELAYTDGRNASTEGLQRGGQHGQQPQDRRVSFWHDAQFIPCTDGKARPVKPGIFPLAYGLPTGLAKLGPELGRLAQVAELDRKSLAGAKSHRIKSLRGAGNAIVAEVGAQFIAAVEEAINFAPR